jgi:hypothetical protein
MPDSQASIAASMAAVGSLLTITLDKASGSAAGRAEPGPEFPAPLPGAESRRSQPPDERHAAVKARTVMVLSPPERAVCVLKLVFGYATP